jgi:putative transposase
MELLQQRDPALSFRSACAVLALPRATLYRRLRPARPARARVRPPSPRRISEPEREAILEVLHSERFADQPPAEVHAALLEEGRYLASPRTMYRILAARNETRERRDQRAPRFAPTGTTTGDGRGPPKPQAETRTRCFDAPMGHSLACNF